MKILLLGPLTPPIHGQSLAFTRFVESLPITNKIVINANLENKSLFGKLIKSISIVFLILFYICFHKIHLVYFTCSRSFLGSIKDIVLINVSKLVGAKIVNHLHGSDFYTFLHKSPKWYKKLLFYSYNKVDTSVVLLDQMKEQFHDFPDMRIEVVSNFYDKELEIKIIDKDPNTINLVYLSNIMVSKGILELIDSFNILSKKYHNLELSIAGYFIADECTDIEKLKTLFYSKIQNKSNIRYIGIVSGIDKIKLLQKSDIFILPSYYKSEAFPISIIEAMVCKNAIVTTNYKYLPSIVSQENGVLVEIKSIDSLTQGIETLLTNTDKLRQIQKHNALQAKEKYHIDNYLNSLHRIVS